MRGKFPRILCTGFMLVHALGAQATAQSSTDAIADRYVEALRNAMDQSATQRQIDSLVVQYTANVVYEHPRIGIRIEGRAHVRDGLVSFLGQTRNPVIEERARIVGDDVAVLHLQMRFEARANEGWTETERVQVTILEISDGFISRIIDYW